MQLNEAQKYFKETLLDDIEALEKTPKDFAALFDEGDIPLSERLKVYRNNIIGGLSDTIALSFPLLEKLVGEDFLKAMARTFAQEHPPEKGCLNTYGAGFDDFIDTLEAGKAMPYLADVARFEIAMTDSYYAPDDKPLSPEELAAVAPEDLNDLKLKLRTSARLIASDFPLDAIRDFCTVEDRGEEETLDINAGGVKLMVYRPDIEVLIVKLEEAEFALLEMLAAGRSLGDAVENIIQSHDGFVFQAFLSRHVELETFSSLETNI